MIKAVYVNHMGDDLTPVNAARISFANASETLTDKDEKLLNYLARHKHYSPFEHCTMTAIIECPLYIRSQIHRHRTFAYNEVSRRYTSENLEFYLPPTEDIRKQAKSNKQASQGALEEQAALQIRHLINHCHEYALGFYNALIEAGVCREQARGVLPQNLMTKFYMTGNLRNWVHFVNLRLDSHAQSEVRSIAEQVKAILLDKFPKASEALFRHYETQTEEKL